MRLGSIAVFLPLITAFAAEPSFVKDVKPILQRSCQGCHAPNAKMSDLDVTTHAALQAGGKRGTPWKPGAPAAESILIKYVTGEIQPRMPMGQPALPADQIDILRAWIAAGAKDDSELQNEPKLPAGPIRYTQAPVINALAYSPDGSTIAISANHEILLTTATGSAPPRRLVGRSERILSLAFSPDGATLVAGGGTPARFGEVQVWDARKGALLHSIPLTADTVFGASLSPDGKTIAVGCADNTVRIFDAATGKELHKIGNHEDWVFATVFGMDGKRIVSAGRDRAAKLTDTASGAFLENINMLRGELYAIARHPQKDVVVIGGDDRIPYMYVMDRPKNMKIADDTTMLRQFERQQGAVAALAWSPDGRSIAVAGASPEVNIYDAETGAKTATCKGHAAGIYTLAWSPDSQTLATGGFDGQVRLYEANSGRTVREFIPVPLETSSLNGRPQ
jgi:WD40 repeat protein